MRHAARPEETLGAGADAAPLDVDDQVVLTGGRQRDATESEALGPLQHDGERVHSLDHAVS
jgi:hypothetical protein